MESRDHSWNVTPAAIPAPADQPLPEGPIHPGSGRGIDWRKLFAPLGALALLALKFGAKLKALLLLLPKIKVFTTSGTMLVSIAAYSLIWGWKFAVGFVALLFVHEMGHVIQLRREGLEASAPMFIPFMGAVVWAKSLGDNATADRRPVRRANGFRPSLAEGIPPGTTWRRCALKGHEVALSCGHRLCL